MESEYIPEEATWLINAGSVQDIKCSLQNKIPDIEYLDKQIELEKARKNRTTVIKLLQRARWRKELGQLKL